MKPKSTTESRRAILRDCLSVAAKKDLGRHAREVADVARETLERISRGQDPDGYLGSTANLIFKTVLLETLADGWTTQALADLARAMSYLELNARYFEASGAPKADGPGTTADHAGTALQETIWTALLYAHFGQWHRARWLAHYLLGYYHGGSVRHPSKDDDVEYYELTRLLLQALAEERWPESFGVALGPYQTLLAHRTDPQVVEQALLEVMDLRMARWLGYAQVDDARPMSQDKAGPMMGALPFAAMPADLWAIQALAHRFDGISLSLEGEHPWLRAAFVTPPFGPLPAFDDELLQQLQALGDRKFSSGWRE